MPGFYIYLLCQNIKKNKVITQIKRVFNKPDQFSSVLLLIRVSLASPSRLRKQPTFRKATTSEKRVQKFHIDDVLLPFPG